MTQSQFFEALGPTSPPPGDSPGFFTYATSFSRGADIQGSKLGIRGTGTGAGAPGVVGQGGLTSGNGVEGRGMNGVVGVTTAAVRNPATEASSPAGVFGVGDDSSGVGVRGEAIGPNAGVHGVSQSAPGNLSGPGVLGVSDDGNGVVGQGEIGVFGHGKTFGVQGGSDDGIGVSGQGKTFGVQGAADGSDGTGVSGEGNTGVSGQGKNGSGIFGTSSESNGGAFHSQKAAQVLLDPLTSFNNDPTQFAKSQAGELAVFSTVAEDGKKTASLWFCTVGGSAAEWQQIA